MGFGEAFGCGARHDASYRNVCDEGRRVFGGEEAYGMRRNET